MTKPRPRPTAAHAGMVELARRGTRGIARILRRQIIRRVADYGISVLLDVLAVVAAFETAAMLRFVATGTLVDKVAHLLIPALVPAAVYAIVSYVMGMHRRLWQYAGVRDGLALLRTLALAAVCCAAIYIALPDLFVLPISVVVGGSLLSILFVGAIKLIPRALRTAQVLQTRQPDCRVLIVGAGQAGAGLAARLMLNRRSGYDVVGFIDDNMAKWGRGIHGRTVFGSSRRIPEVVRRFGIDLIAIAMPSVDSETISKVIGICQSTTARIRILPGVGDEFGGQASQVNLRELDIADLLGRAVVPLQTATASAFLTDKVVLVTGAAGSIGAELCRQVLGYAPKAVIALDNNETGLFDLAEDLRAHRHADRLRLQIADVTDAESVGELLTAQQVQLIFHAAAYKHVPLLEHHTRQAVRTNILATYDLCQLAERAGVETFVFISSDKAANPANTLGASKRIGECIVQAMATTSSRTRFCAVRFGNVIGSRGSVVPVFTSQIDHGGPVRVTHPEVTRYFMTIPEACGLVILAGAGSARGGLFLLDMGDPVRIADLAAKMIRMRGLRVGQDIAIVYTGLRPGEQLHERLTASNERVIPTAHPKILCVASDEDIALIGHIDGWIAELRQQYKQLENAALREYLLQAVGLPALPEVPEVLATDADADGRLAPASVRERERAAKVRPAV